MTASILKYGVVLAAAALVLQWLEYQYVVRMYSTEAYIVLLALLFTASGAWLGYRLSRRDKAPEFQRNDRAIASLGLTSREVQVLEWLAEGGSNSDIAKALFVSTSTVKTHLVHLYQKLEVARRTQAVQKARSLNIIP